jgi:hypothetical protein
MKETELEMYRGVVLAVGVDCYDDAGIDNLDNAVNDARGFASTMQDLGYDVISCMNSSIDDFDAHFDIFLEKIKTARVGIFFYAGHGVERDGKNYLIARNTPTSNEGKLGTRYCIELQEVINKMHGTGCSMTISIIDACRNNPFRNLRGKHAFQLAPVTIPTGSLIAFSTSPGEIAKDKIGKSNHSVYTSTLLHYITEEGVEIEQMFKKVRTTVHNFTGGAQTPWEHTSLIGQFSFNPGNIVSRNFIPYSDDAIADREWDGAECHKIIQGLRTLTWSNQTDAIHKFITYTDEISDDTLFVIGRNLTQTYQGDNYAAKRFVQRAENIEDFTDKDGNNHLLNGMLFEIYFNHEGKFRYTNFKGNILSELIRYNQRALLKHSFEFIQKILIPYSSYLLFTPSPTPTKVTLDVIIESQKIESLFYDSNKIYNIIRSIKRADLELLTDVKAEMSNNIAEYFSNALQLKKVIAAQYCAPVEYLELIGNVDLTDSRDLIFYDTNFKKSLRTASLTRN